MEEKKDLSTVVLGWLAVASAGVGVAVAVVILHDKLTKDEPLPLTIAPEPVEPQPAELGLVHPAAGGRSPTYEELYDYYRHVYTRGDRPYGQPRSEEERALRHQELYGTAELPPRGRGLGN